MINIALLIICLIVGVVLRKKDFVPKDAHLTLNSLIIYLFVPAITLRYGLDLKFTPDLFLPVASAWIVFLGSFVFFNVINGTLGFDKNTTGALIVTSGISSISFVGFPIFELLYGEEGLKAGIILSQAGTFIVCSTLGIFVATAYADQSKGVQWSTLLKSNLTFPPFLAFCIAMLCNLLHFRPSDNIMDILEKIGNPLSITALLSIGMQMSFDGLNFNKTALSFGLIYKLLLAPLLVFVVFFLLIKSHGISAKVSVVGSALGSMNTMGIVAIKKGLNPRLITALLAISIPLSLLLIPIIYFILQLF